jgi:hypothetical protein
LDLAYEVAAGGQQAIAVTKQWLNELDGSMDDEPSLTGARLSAQVIAGSEAQERLRSIFKS